MAHEVLDVRSPDIEGVYREFNEALNCGGGATRDHLVGALLSLYSQIGSRLELLRGNEFAKAWLLRLLAQELLKYSIEDDRIDLAPMVGQICERVSALAVDSDWLTPGLRSTVDLCRVLGGEKPIAAKHVSIPIQNGTGSMRALVPKDASRLIQVSTKSVNLVPLLEDSVSDPRYVHSVGQAFAFQLRQLSVSTKFDRLCFIEKEVGPVGAICLLGYLVAELSVPACIYRSSHWVDRTLLAGSAPRPKDKIVLVYDLLVTGDGIVQAARELMKRHDVEVVAAVVLFGFDKARDFLDVDGRRIAVRSLGWYHKAKIMPDKSRERRSAPDLIGITASVSIGKSLQTEKGGPMTRASGRQLWRASLGFYEPSELRAIKFKTNRDLDKALDLFWNPTSVLFRLPRQAAGDRTLLVPEESLKCFIGIKFSSHNVVSAGSRNGHRAHQSETKER